MKAARTYVNAVALFCVFGALAFLRPGYVRGSASAPFVRMQVEETAETHPASPRDPPVSLADVCLARSGRSSGR
jgi:hypothetical protein